MRLNTRAASGTIPSAQQSLGPSKWPDRLGPWCRGRFVSRTLRWLRSLRFQRYPTLQVSQRELLGPVGGLNWPVDVGLAHIFIYRHTVYFPILLGPPWWVRLQVNGTQPWHLPIAYFGGTNEKGSKRSIWVDAWFQKRTLHQTSRGVAKNQESTILFLFYHF